MEYSSIPLGALSHQRHLANVQLGIGVEVHLDPRGAKDLLGFDDEELNAAGLMFSLRLAAAPTPKLGSWRLARSHRKFFRSLRKRSYG